MAGNWSVISDEEPLSDAAIQRVVTLSLLMPLTLLGNVWMLRWLGCSSPPRRRRLSLFMLHLAVGDLCVCGLTMSVELLLVLLNRWILGGLACKLLMYAQIVALASTIFILLAMSYDRYLAVCRPLTFHLSSAKKSLALAWLAAFVLALPQLLVFVQVQSGVRADGAAVYACRSSGYSAWWQRRLYLTLLTLIVLLVPAGVILFCYLSILRVVWRQGQGLRKSGPDQLASGRAKVKTLKLTLSIILAFLLCWTPYFVVHNLRVHSYYQLQVPEPLVALSETLAMLNSALNPLLYACFDFRLNPADNPCCWRSSPSVVQRPLVLPSADELSSTLPLDELSGLPFAPFLGHRQPHSVDAELVPV